MSLGAGLGKLQGKVFRIGHLGEFNDLMLMGTLAGVEMGLRLAGVPHRAGGVDGGDGQRWTPRQRRAGNGSAASGQRSAPDDCAAETTVNLTSEVRWTRFKATHVVLLLLCACTSSPMSTGSTSARRRACSEGACALEHRSSVWCFPPSPIPISLFQIIGGWFGDRFGPRRTLFVVRADLGGRHDRDRPCQRPLDAVRRARRCSGFGEGATFPTATPRDVAWLPGGKSGFAQGITHAAARLGNAITPPRRVLLIAW